MRRALTIIIFTATLGVAFYAGLRGGHAQRRADHGGDAPSQAPRNADNAKKNESPALAAPQMHRAADYEALKTDRARGDADAAYRIARGAQACTDMRGMRARLQTATDNEREARTVSLATLTIDCIGDENVTSASLRDAWRLAAQLGSREAQFHYAVNPLVNPLALGGDDFDYLRDWHAHAAGYLESAAADGDGRAAIVLALAHDPQRLRIHLDDGSGELGGPSTLIAEAYGQDPEIAYRYYVLDLLLSDEANRAWIIQAIERLESNLSEAQILAARKWAQTAYLRSNNGR